MKNLKWKTWSVDCGSWTVHFKVLRFFKLFGYEFGIAKLLREAPDKIDFKVKKGYGKGK